MRKVFIQHNCTYNGIPVSPVVIEIKSDEETPEHGTTTQDEGFIQLANTYIKASHTYLITDKSDEELITEYK